MADQFGVSFLPGGDAQYKRQGRSAAAPLQEAIKVLSLRVPRVVGASPLAPLALLSGMGGGGMPSGVIETLLRALSPPQDAPPVAAMPEGVLPASEPQMGAEAVPQAVPPQAPGVPQPAMAGRPQVAGAMSGMPPPRPQALMPLASMPMPSVTAGAREELPPEQPPPPITGYQPPPQPQPMADSLEDVIRRELEGEESWRRGQAYRRALG